MTRARILKKFARKPNQAETEIKTIEKRISCDDESGLKKVSFIESVKTGADRHPKRTCFATYTMDRVGHDFIPVLSVMPGIKLGFTDKDFSELMIVALINADDIIGNPTHLRTHLKLVKAKPEVASQFLEIVALKNSARQHHYKGELPPMNTALQLLFNYT